jgi:hypothetical protein
VAAPARSRVAVSPLHFFVEDVAPQKRFVETGRSKTAHSLRRTAPGIEKSQFRKKSIFVCGRTKNGLEPCWTRASSLTRHSCSTASADCSRRKLEATLGVTRQLRSSSTILSAVLSRRRARTTRSGCRENLDGITISAHTTALVHWSRVPRQRIRIRPAPRKSSRRHRRCAGSTGAHSGAQAGATGLGRVAPV